MKTEEICPCDVLRAASAPKQNRPPLIQKLNSETGNDEVVMPLSHTLIIISHSLHRFRKSRSSWIPTKVIEYQEVNCLVSLLFFEIRFFIFLPEVPPLD